jgi:predicted DsbA family dithiol-disulfide isomerase
MPIDGDVWISDPLDSSYPPSIAFKAAELQDVDKAQAFLRIMREMVFIRKVNIAKWENIQSAAAASGLDTHRLKINFDGQARTLFQEDLLLAKSMGVRGFPTIFITDIDGNSEKIYGFKPYTVFEEVLAKIAAHIVKQSYEKSWEAIFSRFYSLTLREFSELTDSAFPAAQTLLDRLVEEGRLSVLVTKNGNIWSRKECK